MVLHVRKHDLPRRMTIADTKRTEDVEDYIRITVVATEDPG